MTINPIKRASRKKEAGKESRIAPRKEEAISIEETLQAIAYFKRLLASGEPLYGKRVLVEPPLSKEEKSLLIKNEDGTPDNSRIFGYYLLMKRFLSKKDFEDMKKGILSLIERYPHIDLKTGYGFPDNWREIL